MQRLVVCADGTWKSKDDSSDATNVEKFCEVVLPAAADGTVQRAEYFPGVGVSRWDRIRGGAFGWGLSRNVKQCYRWLVDHAGPDDELYLFGFSRGAFTVRSLAGMIRNVGLLTPANVGLLDEAYSHYRDRDPQWRVSGARAIAFRERWSRELPRLRCLGVWDTVGALGVPTRGPIGALTRRRWGFHDVELSGKVENAFHALAIDERRRAFAPTLWQADAEHARVQHVEQVWFAGTHSNVGGGHEDCGLSDTTLVWMAERARNCGLELDDERLRRLAPDAAQGQLYDSYTRLYRLQRPYVRRLCEEPPSPPGRSLLTHQRVHESALERRERCTDPPRGPYLPSNLLDYLSSAQPPPTGLPRGDAAHTRAPSSSPSR
jgi:uncharacterized protein (DUF2235 family)